MAGGAGERFWPLSRKSRPKQLLKLTGSGKTMIEEAVERVDGIIPKENIFIIANSLLLNPIREALPDLPPENVIAEPAKRNTAPCLALSTSIILAKFPDAEPENISVAVLTSDQMIKNIDGFKETVNIALSYVEANPDISIIGINPTRPETGYGYIETEHKFSDKAGDSIQKVLRFREKPSRELAEEFLASGRFLWNSGMFFYRLDTFIDGMKEHLRQVGDKIEEMKTACAEFVKSAHNSYNSEIKELFESFPDISIDFALMEKASNVVVARALFDWDDVGSWDALERTRSFDEMKNITEGNTELLETNNSIVLNLTHKNDVVLAALGLEDFAVVATDDAIMICPKERVQEVRKLVQKLRNDKKDKYLD